MIEEDDFSEDFVNYLSARLPRGKVQLQELVHSYMTDKSLDNFLRISKIIKDAGLTMDDIKQLA